MRILYIEDDARIAQNVQEFLESELFQVDHTSNGLLGYEMAVQNSYYDLIITDRLLPGMEGLEIVTSIRAKGISTPVLMLTALDSTDQRVDGLESGADDYLIKPFSLKELLARIRSLLRRNSGSSSLINELVIEDLVLSFATKKVFRNHQEITLSRKQFEILEYLMRNQGKVISKQELEEHVWNSRAELWSDVVRSHIQTLRAKIDTPFSKPLIKTIHGMGYTIEV